MLRVWCSEKDYQVRVYNEIFFYDGQRMIRNLIVNKGGNNIIINNIVPVTIQYDLDRSRTIEECKQCVYGLRMALSKCKKDHTFKPI